nr:protein O-mannosyl-transferase 2-like [Halyomorpha halys]
MCSTLGIVKFYNHRHYVFSRKWWFWLCFTGVMLACAVSVKFVGIFVVILCGFHTISQLWEVLTDLSKPMVVSEDLLE